MAFKLTATVFVVITSLFLLSLNITGLALQNNTSHLTNLLTNYSPPPQPLVSTNLPPALMAQAAILVDVSTNTVLFNKNPNLKVFPASTTKLATALTALNLYPLDEVVTISTPYQEGKIMELEAGEKLTVKSLVTALLIYSANDAAVALADHYNGGHDAFVAQMNQLAKKYGLTNTNFVNVDGIHHINHFSTVSDLAQLGRLSIQNPIVLNTVGFQQVTVESVDGTVKHDLTTTNELLGEIPEIKGLKTGWTPEAGGCFIGLIELNDHQLISVVAGSDDRFTDTRLIVNWAKSNLSWTQTPPASAISF